MNKIVNYQIELHIYTAQSIEQLNAQRIEDEKVYIHSHTAYDQIVKEQHKADILFLPLAFVSPIPEVLHTSAPGKLGEYLACGRPVLAHVPDDSFVAHYFRENNCGVIAGESNVDSLSEHIQHIIDDVELRRVITTNARICSARDFDPVKSQAALKNFLGVK